MLFLVYYSGNLSQLVLFVLPLSHLTNIERWEMGRGLRRKEKISKIQTLLIDYSGSRFKHWLPFLVLLFSIVKYSWCLTLRMMVFSVFTDRLLNDSPSANHTEHHSLEASTLAPSLMSSNIVQFPVIIPRALTWILSHHELS